MTLTEIKRSARWAPSQISPRRDDAESRARKARSDELVRQVVARDDQELCVTPSETVEPRLRARAKKAVVDPARRLVEDADHGELQPVRGEGRAGERSGDRVEEDGARRTDPRAPKHGGTAQRSERKGPLRKREKDDPRAVRGGRLGHPEVVEIAPAQAAGIA